ncbi:MAG: D-tyrosyl-tRNA(Tyr) deacylase [Burkholderiales bacterium]|nr:D-tyrosyl-tRNA(Tyr) deacylase [Burkholderiales bacterium]
MRVLLQRVSEADVTAGGRVTGAIGPGLLALVGIAPTDTPAHGERLARKIVNLRVFDDDAGVMNRSALDVGAEVLAVSQFTLYASTDKGNRPSYTGAARPEVAAPLFDAFVATLAGALGKPVPTGVFGAHMAVRLVNDGPVTIWLES